MDDGLICVLFILQPDLCDAQRGAAFALQRGKALRLLPAPAGEGGAAHAGVFRLLSVDRRGVRADRAAHAGLDLEPFLPGGYAGIAPLLADVCDLRAVCGGPLLPLSVQGPALQGLDRHGAGERDLYVSHHLQPDPLCGEPAAVLLDRGGGHRLLGHQEGDQAI